MTEISPFVHTPHPDQTTVERLVAIAIYSDAGRFWGGPFGSQLWTLAREPLTPAVVDTAKTMVHTALQPLEKAGLLVVGSIDAEVDRGQLSLSVHVTKGTEEITVRMDDVFGVFYGT